MARVRKAAEADTLRFEEAAGVLKALGHPLRLRLVCGLTREPSNLTRIVAALQTPISTVALHLGVLRRAGLLHEERHGAEVLFSVADERVGQILDVFCEQAGPPPANWDWENLARSLNTISGSQGSHEPHGSQESLRSNTRAGRG